MKYSEINHSGYINTKSGKHMAYDLIDGHITIHANEYIPELENTNIVVASGFEVHIPAERHALSISSGTPLPVNSA